MSDAEKTLIGTVFDIKRFAVHDGPGIRTTLFLKGCPLRCPWCQNPEGFELELSLQYFASKCIGCGSCVEVCPEGALAPERELIVIDRVACTSCGDCVRICPARALVFDGWTMSVDEAVMELLKDRDFFLDSGGGITLSGGEPLFQGNFIKAVLGRMKDEGIHTAIETSLFGPPDLVEDLIPLVDLFIADLKILDAARHREVTARDNGIILQNFKRLAASGADILIRVPMIPGYTVDSVNLCGIREFADSCRPGLRIELINFNPLPESKYRSLDKKYMFEHFKQPFSPREMCEFYTILRSYHDQ